MALATYGTKIDLREVPPRDRHALVFNTYRILEPGQTMELVNDHDPEPLFHQLQERFSGGFGWDYLVRGPSAWHVRILRIDRDHGGMSTETPFDQLLAAAAAQSQRQILLFVFAAAQLPADATPAQRARYEEGAGGELTPLMCVEKSLDELSTFDALVSESRAVGPPWHVVFAAGLAGKDGQPPSAEAVEDALRTMVERVKSGAVQSFLALSPQGDSLSFI